MKIKADVLELARQGAAYHKIPYQTYLQWLIEVGLTNEATYYGWRKPPGPIHRNPTQAQRIAIKRLLRNASRKRKD